MSENEIYKMFKPKKDFDDRFKLVDYISMVVSALLYFYLLYKYDETNFIFEPTSWNSLISGISTNPIITIGVYILLIFFIGPVFVCGYVIIFGIINNLLKKIIKIFKKK